MTEQSFPPGARLVFYGRDSGGRDQDKSVEQQEAAAGEWCRERGYVLSRTFKDAARSGSSTAGRDAFLSMVEYLSGEVPEKGILLWEYARFSRSYDDLMYYLADLRRQGYTVHSLSDHIPEGLEGRLMESIVAWKNARYLEDLKRGIIRGRRHILTAYGAVPGGDPPTGYKFERVEIGKRRDGSPHVVPKLIPDPDTAALVKRAFEMRARGATYKEIHQATHLFRNIQNYQPLLHKSVYMGDMQYGDMLLDGFCEPLIDRATWQEAQQINQARRERGGIHHPRAVHSRFILSGLIYCARCGSRMQATVYPKHERKQYDYYRCHSPWENAKCGAKLIPKAEIEKIVLSALREQILQPRVLEDLYTRAQARTAGDRERQSAAAVRMQSELAETRERIRRLVSAIAEAGHSRAMLDQLAAMETREAELREAIARAEIEARPLPIIDFETLTRETGKALDVATEQQKAVILRGFVSRVTAEKIDHKVRGEIEFSLPGVDGSSHRQPIG